VGDAVNRTHGRGGSRPGAGRKALDAQGTIVTTVRLTAEQAATLQMLGGGKWLRDQLQAVIDSDQHSHEGVSGS
jgi:hypothetical protein